MSRRGPGWAFGIHGAAVATLGAGLVLAASGRPVHPIAWGFSALVFAVAGAVAAERERRAALALSDAAEAERERLRLAMDRQRSSVDLLADGLDVALFVADEKGYVLYANRRAREFFRAEDPVRRSLLAVTLSHDLEALVLAAAGGGEVPAREIAFSYPEDRIAQAKAWGSPDGRVFLSLFDVTTLRKLERIRQDFVANVSHEMRTPMTIVRAFAETLLDDDDPGLRKRYLEKIIAEVDRLSTISQDLLVLSTAESNPVRKQVCDLADVVLTVVEQLQEKAEGKGLALTFDGPEELTIAANVSQMRQVALNLVDNALNYTLEGGVHVEIRPQEDRVVLTVADTGIGIASEHVGRVFERFYRVDKARSRSTGGTGLGLAIVRHIVEAHGGTVGLESALNEGTTFTVLLPTTDRPLAAP